MAREPLAPLRLVSASERGGNTLVRAHIGDEACGVAARMARARERRLGERDGVALAASRRAHTRVS